MTDEQIKKKLDTLATGKEMFTFLGKLWLDDKIIGKDQYLEYITYWKEHKPQSKTSKWVDDVKKEFNDEGVQDEIPF